MNLIIRKVYKDKLEIREYKLIISLVVRIAAFQAVDPGSSPG
jgi:hypothetical protein